MKEIERQTHREKETEIDRDSRRSVIEDRITAWLAPINPYFPWHTELLGNVRIKTATHHGKGAFPTGPLCRSIFRAMIIIIIHLHGR